MIRISLFSNYLNIHQLPLAKALSETSGVDFKFVSYVEADEEMGRKNLDSQYGFVIAAYLDKDNYIAAMDRACYDDIVIMAPMDGFEPFRDARDEMGGVTFLYSERLLKRGQWWRFIPPKRRRVHRQFLDYRNCKPYILCASAFTEADLMKFGFDTSRCLRWGYFPQINLKNDMPLKKSLSGPLVLCSAQRHVPWKHIEYQIYVLQRLLNHGFELILRIAGDGPETARLKRLAEKLGVSGSVVFLGRLSHEETLSLMEGSDVFLATSDRNEGWGATINEAMSAGCVVVGSSLIGAIPFLIRNGIDGFIYADGSLDDLEDKLKLLITKPEMLSIMSASARERVSGLWGIECAMQRILECCETLLKGETLPHYDDGPMSPAPLFADNWYSDQGGVK